MIRFLSEAVLERKRCWVLFSLVVFSALLFLPGLGARDLWAPGEPIYGEVIRAMYERNDWLVPMLNGQIYADKPVLYFWLALAAAKFAGGVNEWTLRLPTALGGLGLVIVTYYFGKTFYDRRTGLLSALVLATSSRLLWESRFLRLDTVLSFFLFLGFYFWLKAFTKKAPRHHYLLGYLCFALATLTKGPLGIAIPGFALLALVLVSRRWREIRELRLFTGAIVIALVLAPWLLLLHFGGKDQWLRDFIWIHNVQNFALKPIGHVHPFYYYFFNLPPDFLPWTLLVPGALVFYYPWKKRLQDPATLGLLCWFGATFLFFSASKSKIAYYLLPLLPSLALFVGCYLKDLFSAEREQGKHWKLTAGFLYLLACLLGLAGAALSPLIYRIEPALFLLSFPISAILIAGAAGIFVSVRRYRMEWFIFSLLTVLLGTFVIVSVGVFPYLDKYKSPRPLGEFVRLRLPAKSPVYVFKSTMADFNYYAGREEIPVIKSEDEVRKMAATGREIYLLISDRDLKQLKATTGANFVTDDDIGGRKWYLVKIS